MSEYYCVCCGQRFERSCRRGRAPRYCSASCRRQMAVRRRAWDDDWQVLPSLQSGQQEPSSFGTDSDMCRKVGSSANNVLSSG